MVVRSVTPHIPSSDVQLTRDFFVDVFGFKTLLERPEFIELGNGAWLLGIVPSTGTPNQQSVYLEVQNLDELWQAQSGLLAQLKHRAPFTQPYGMREFHVVAPGTNTLVFVGEELE